MGLLRILLALGVASEHAGDSLFAASYTAVQIFFIISGFYMALILSTNRYQSASQFYASRMFRLVPLYWASILIAITLALGMHYIAGVNSAVAKLPGIMAEYSETNILRLFWLLFSNAFLILGDIAWFISPDHNGHPTSLLVLPPVWTLALELYFYMLCPLLIRLRTSTLCCLAIAVFGLRVIGYLYGMDANPYHARFFPFEIIFFLMGMIAYRLYASENTILTKILTSKAGLLIGAAYIYAVINFYDLVKKYPAPSIYSHEAYIHTFIMCLLAIPAIIALFHHTKNLTLDRFIGELSYPVYILHYCFVSTFLHTKYLDPQSGFWIVLGATLVISALLHIYIQTPLDRWRIKRFANSTALQPARKFSFTNKLPFGLGGARQNTNA